MALWYDGDVGVDAMRTKLGGMRERTYRAASTQAFMHSCSVSGEGAIESLARMVVRSVRTSYLLVDAGATIARAVTPILNQMIVSFMRRSEWMVCRYRQVGLYTRES